MTTYTVKSLDVWGHGPSECRDYGCPCISIQDDDSDLTALSAMIEAGFLREGVTLETVSFEDHNGMGESITVENKETGEPLFILESEES